MQRSILQEDQSLSVDTRGPTNAGKMAEKSFTGEGVEVEGKGRRTGVGRLLEGVDPVAMDPILQYSYFSFCLPSLF